MALAPLCFQFQILEILLFRTGFTFLGTIFRVIADDNRWFSRFHAMEKLSLDWATSCWMIPRTNLDTFMKQMTIFRIIAQKYGKNHQHQAWSNQTMVGISRCWWFNGPVFTKHSWDGICARFFTRVTYPKLTWTAKFPIVERKCFFQDPSFLGSSR